MADAATEPQRHLAVLLSERGDREGAEQLYRRAAYLGDAVAMKNLAALIARWGDAKEAERLYGQASNLDHPSDW